MTMQASEKLFLQTVGRFVAERYKTWVAPLMERIEKLEVAFATPTLSETDVTRIVESAMARGAADAQKQIGRDDVAYMIAEAVAAIPAGPQGPPGKDGTNGVNGTNGESVSMDMVGAAIDARITEAVGKLPVPNHVVSGFIDRCGNLHHVFNDGTTLDFGKVAATEIDKDDLREWVQ